jgi:hypothetical protein
MARNLPDDWDCYWRTCGRCGQEYHASEGGCDCEPEDDDGALGEEDRAGDCNDMIGQE